MRRGQLRRPPAAGGGCLGTCNLPPLGELIIPIGARLPLCSPLARRDFGAQSGPAVAPQQRGRFRFGGALSRYTVVIDLPVPDTVVICAMLQEIPSGYT